MLIFGDSECQSKVGHVCACMCLFAFALGVCTHMTLVCVYMLKFVYTFVCMCECPLCMYADARSPGSLLLSLLLLLNYHLSVIYFY